MPNLSRAQRAQETVPFARKLNEEIKKSGKDAAISEDEIKRSQEDIQKLTDQYIHKVDEVLKKKEQEIMEV